MSEKELSNNKVIGIDLGTTMSCMAGMVNGELSIIENRDGERVTPSVVCFDKETGAPVVGSNAILAASNAPKNFVYEAKRMIGKGISNPDIIRSKNYWPFRIIEIKTSGDTDANTADNIGIEISEKGTTKVYEPIQISACVLSYLLESAKCRLGVYPAFAVITVPAYFSDLAKRRTIDAAKIAYAGKTDEKGNPLVFDVKLLAEPTAAAMAYGSLRIKNNQMRNGDEERVMVFDFGGGTFDVSLVDFSCFENAPVGLVKGTDGDNYLGGADFDNIIVEMAKTKFAEQNGANFDAGMSEEDLKKSDLRLRQEAIKVKAALSSNPKTTFNLSCYRGTKDLVFEITRVQFERASRAIFPKLLERCKGALLSTKGVNPVYTNAGMLDVAEIVRANQGVKDVDSLIESAKAEVKKVIMVGGSSRIPKVKAVLEEFFGETESTNPANKRVVSPLNQDEAIAYGAGYFANTSRPEDGGDGKTDLLLVDTVPLNLNIDTLGGIATKIIEANTAIPCTATQTFSTAADNQTSVEIVITQGNRAMTADNHRVGSFSLMNIPPAARGVPKIEVKFEINSDNVLNVTARELTSNITNQITISNSDNKLSEENLEEMRKAAVEHAKKDAEIKEAAEARNTYDNLLYSALDKLDSAAGDEANKASLKALISDEQKWLAGANSSTSDEIKARMEEFTKKMGDMMSGSAATGATQV